MLSGTETRNGTRRKIGGGVRWPERRASQGRAGKNWKQLRGMFTHPPKHVLKDNEFLLIGLFKAKLLLVKHFDQGSKAPM
jgi:hypothetical protein